MDKKSPITRATTWAQEPIVYYMQGPDDQANLIDQSENNYGFYSGYFGSLVHASPENTDSAQAWDYNYGYSPLGEWTDSAFKFVYGQCTAWGIVGAPEAQRADGTVLYAGVNSMNNQNQTGWVWGWQF